MSEITDADAYEFAAAMAGLHPPTNTHLIRKHIDWWKQNHPEHAIAVCNWYTEWIGKVEDDSLAGIDEYSTFTSTLSSLEIPY